MGVTQQKTVLFRITVIRIHSKGRKDLSFALLIRISEIAKELLNKGEVNGKTEK